MRKLALPIALVFGFAMIGCSDDDNCVDVDGDGYGEGADCMGTDCDDDDNTAWVAMEAYSDADEDGENSDTVTNLCNDGEMPAGFSATAGTDCDDTDADAIMMVDGYVDLDLDGYGDSEIAVQQVCGDTDFLPPGYADNGDDCDDASAVLFASVTGYADEDGDGEPLADLETFCATTMTPTWLSDTAGTDCDDDDVMATNDASHGAMCTIKGLCVDTEPMMGYGMPDMAGIGACAGVDCNGIDPTVSAPMTDSGNSCVTDANCAVGQICKDFTGGTDLTCWGVPQLCNNVALVDGGLTCSELTTCLSVCNVVHDGDDAGRLNCVQFDCFEESTPVAQQLYDIAQTCAAAAGCFTEDDFIACALVECYDEFAIGCMGDVPAP
jgi:hypothetical protein